MTDLKKPVTKYKAVLLCLASKLQQLRGLTYANVLDSFNTENGSLSAVGFATTGSEFGLPISIQSYVDLILKTNTVCWQGINEYFLV